MEEKTDQIRIRGLELFAGHGVSPAENELGQKFRINASLYLDIREAAAEDEISKTVHYGKVCRFMTAFMQQHTFRLIETAAQRLAEEILLKWPRIARIDLEIEKPWAPIGLPLENVSVAVSRGWEEVYLSAGSNLGDRKAYLEQAFAALAETRGIRVLKTSDIIETAPYGPVEQDSFLNAAVRLETILPPHELLEKLQEIENAAGRERSIHWGPRTLDLDILFYGDRLIDMPDLIVPHPDLENRLFVLAPMLQIAPYFRDPASGKTVKQLYDELMSAGEEACAPD